MSLSTVEQLHDFHSQDREIFAKLVLKFSRAPAESLLVMATWFWLENFGFKHIFSVIMSLSDPLIISLADEAVSCFRCLEFNKPPNGFKQIPLTARFMEKDISLQIIYKYRYSAIIGIKNFLSTVCSRIFSDIIQRALLCPLSSSNFSRLCSPLNIPGFPHPTFGNIVVMPHVVCWNNIPNNNPSLIPSDLWGWHTTCIATENDRTIFLTFSRGFSVSEAEVKKLFTQKYGEGCVVGVFMPDVSGNSFNKNGQQQSLYARLVLDSVVTVDRILKGNSLNKFDWSGKHIWARKYKKRRKRF
ncbi:hypothetical protein EUTSA_v10005525mg [Eutrema salsugineum]|uniref:RRM domain-containing protein n=1 Tax=Eutrema salsugineum TaxID=72664 RepID=V4K6M4_EUTSA|nr:uncharacterized protein LOC18011766 [Eutrema salsugineum]ESQ33230.1 hypothetical protein EUTSA_v10005525mg [Eutrema salsugineum]